VSWSAVFFLNATWMAYETAQEVTQGSQKDRNIDRLKRCIERVRANDLVLGPRREEAANSASKDRKTDGHLRCLSPHQLAFLEDLFDLGAIRFPISAHLNAV